MKSGFQRDISTSIFVTIFCPIHNSQDVKQPRCQSVDEWVKKMWCVQREFGPVSGMW